MKENNIEYILCAAIHNPQEVDITGAPLIHCGHRHANILWQSRDISRNPYHQGFLTNKGRYVDRKEGARIAILAEQIEDVNKETLYSEDLY